MVAKTVSKLQKNTIGGKILKERLLEDMTFTKFKRIVRSMKEGVDLDKIVAECKVMHDGRKSRTFLGTMPGVDKLMLAMAQDSAFRSRMAKLRVELSLDFDKLEVAVDAIRTHLTDMYREEISDLKTKGERQSYFDKYLDVALVFQARIKSVITQLDFLIKDIDQMGYTYTNLLKCHELVANRRNDT